MAEKLASLSGRTIAIESGRMALQLPKQTPRTAQVVTHATPTWSASRYQTPDDLFEALDGRTLAVGRRTWQLEIFGVRDLGGQRWIQAGLIGRHERTMVTMRRAPSSATAQHVVLVLSSWLADRTEPGGSSSVLNVA